MGGSFSEDTSNGPNYLENCIRLFLFVVIVLALRGASITMYIWSAFDITLVFTDG